MISLRATVDRIEEQKAVLFIGEENYRIIVPVNLLPENAAEGTVLSIQIEVDPSATEEARQRVQGLINKLSGGEEG
jgi:hypothetical protein